MKFFLFIALSFLCLQKGIAQQKSISITIDDVPNTSLYQKDNSKAILLEVLDSLNIPFTIFINEYKVFKSDSINRSKQFLERWIKHKNALIGNHTYSHLRYSGVGFGPFVKDIDKGALLSKSYSTRHGKSLSYFRFPFNDLGADSIQHTQIREYLDAEGYIIAPFTIESSDWMFDYVYQHYLSTGQLEKAKTVGMTYVDKTIDMVRFFEEMALSVYGRNIKHIYLCHDNKINADYLKVIVSKLQDEKYAIESFEDSLADPVYSQKDIYHKKWGISWLYRWMDSNAERIKWMKQEPDLTETQNMYNELTKK